MTTTQSSQSSQSSRSTPSASTVVEGSIVSGWESTLDTLEGDVTALEQQIPVGVDPGMDLLSVSSLSDWTPPEGLGPLPEHLRERAVQILQRQLMVAEGLVTQITFSKRQRDLAARMLPLDRPAAAFIDQSL